MAPKVPAAPKDSEAQAVDLEVLAERINTAYRESQRHAQTALSLAREAGDWLLQAKEQCCEHGEWLPWLATHCPDISTRTINGYMRLARHCRDNPEAAEQLKQLSLRQALGALAKPRICNAVADLKLATSKPEPLPPPTDPVVIRTTRLTVSNASELREQDRVRVIDVQMKLVNICNDDMRRKYAVTLIDACTQMMTKGQRAKWIDALVRDLKCKPRPKAKASKSNGAEARA